MAYLDANATQPLRPQARDAMLAMLGLHGNPSSVHTAGRAARRVLEDARDSIAALYGATAENLIFTSGGTEANNLGIQALGIQALGGARRVIVSAIEHDAVLQATASPTILPARPDGTADLTALEAMLADGIPSLVCLMLANNETGVIQPVARAAALCHRHGALLHVDAVQGGGRTPVSLDALHCDSLAISAHKLGGPIGIGALMIRDAALFQKSLITGGGQELGRRGGTQSALLAAGFAAAAQASRQDDLTGIAALRDRAEAAAMACGAQAIGATLDRLPNTTSLLLPGVTADQQVISLDVEGIQVSAGAACSSGKVSKSHVLLAMGLGDAAGQAIRVSLPWNVTPADIDAFIAAYQRMTERIHPLVQTPRRA
jgi:cysteine desulfurase